MPATYEVTTTRRRVIFHGTLENLAAYIRTVSEGRASDAGRLRSVREIDTEAYVNRGAIVPLEA